MRRIRAFERVRDDGAAHSILLAAMKVINRHSLTDEFVVELMRPIEEKNKATAEVEQPT
jgi:hypothetical protein